MIRPASWLKRKMDELRLSVFGKADNELKTTNSMYVINNQNLAN